MTATTDDIMKFLNTMKVQAEKNSDDLKKHVKEKIDELTEKVEKAKKEADEKENRDKIQIEKMCTRLNMIEDNLKDTKNKCEKRKKEEEEQRKRANDFKEAVGLETNEEPIVWRQQSWSDLVEKSKKKEEERRARTREENREKNWKKEIEIKERVEKDKENEKLDDKEKKKIIDKQTKELAKKEKEMKLKKLKDELKIGNDSGDSHNEEDWSWEESDAEWQGTEDRKEKEKKKKIERYRRRKHMEEKTAKKAHHMIGLGPIRQNSVDYFMTITADYTLAKEMAVREFLNEYLQFTEEEIENFVVIDTMISKEQDIIYVTFANHDSIKDIQSRVAEVRLDEVSTRIYIPPQYWARYSALSNYCKRLREDNKNLKTIIRFSEKDVEVLVKDRNMEGQYKVVPLMEIEKTEDIPKFDHSIQWRRRQDRPPKMKVKPVLTKIVPPSMKQSEMQRQRSTDSTEMMTTKRRKQDESQMEVSK